MLFSVIEDYHSLREAVPGLLSNAQTIPFGIILYVRRSTLSEANVLRKNAVFEGIYMDGYKRQGSSLADSRYQADMKRLYAMDSTTITLFKEILKGCGRIRKAGKRKVE
jgi:hypothetical protein